MSRKVQLGILALILLLSFVLRLYKIDAPLADWHSWRQADTASVARNFVKKGIDLLHPKYDDLSNITSGRENPEGYRMVEFPIFALLHASFFKIFPIISFEGTGRLLSVLFSLGTIIFLFLIVEHFTSFPFASVAAFVYAVLPFNIYYNRVILPEPMMVAMSLGAVYFFIRVQPFLHPRGEKNKGSPMVLKFSILDKVCLIPRSLHLGGENSEIKSVFFLLISAVFLAISLLLKPFAIFLIAPPILYLTFKRFLESKKKIYWVFGLFVYLLIGLLPFLAWRLWIQQFPEGIPANLWLLNGDGIRFKGAWFYWLFAERVGKLILGYWGVVFFTLGLLARPTRKESYLFHFWLLGCLTYMAVVATGNVRHDYYQILIIPLICVFVAKGVLFLITKSDQFFNRPTCYLLLVTCFIFMEAFAWYHVRDFFNINHPEIVQAGQGVDKLARQEEKVIAPYSGDTAFLYQTNRKGWPIGGSIVEKIKKEAAYYVSVKFDEETLDLTRRCQVLEEKENFIIISLKRCNFN